MNEDDEKGTIIILRNPNALLVPELGALLERALNSIALTGAERGIGAVAEDILDYVRDPRHFLILGATEGAFRCVIMMNLPTRALFPHPQLTLAYNEGPRWLLKKAQAKALEITIENGYTKLWAVNASGHSDKAWEKAFELDGVKASRIGSLYEFAVA